MGRGGGISLPSGLGSLGEHRSSPSAGSGAELPVENENDFCALFVRKIAFGE